MLAKQRIASLAIAHVNLSICDQELDSKPSGFKSCQLNPLADRF